jgi:hypothetical protein
LCATAGFGFGRLLIAYCEELCKLPPLRRNDALAIVIVLAFLGILILAAAILYLT